MSQSNSESYDSISMDLESSSSNFQGLKYLPSWPAVNLEFDDIVYSVEDFESKSILIII